MRKSVALSLLSLSLLACGGGGGGSDSLPSGSGSGNTGVFVETRSVSTDRNSVSVGESLRISWEVSFSSVNGLYTAEVYVSPSQEVPSPKYNYRIHTANCGNGSIYTCGTSGQVTCTYAYNLSGYPVFNCGSTNTSVPFTGDGYLVFRACIWDSNLNYVCSKKALPLRVN